MQNKTIKVSDLQRHLPLPQVPPPPEIAARFKSCDLFLAFDLETHIKVPEDIRVSNWENGRFGHKARVLQPTLAKLRLVELGWAMGSRSTVTITDRLVKPDGFEIENEIIEKRSLTHDRCLRDGSELREVLKEFIDNALACVEAGGRLVAHHLETKS